MLVERHFIESRDQWLALRAHNINASEVGIVCGEGAYGSLAELFAEKKGLRPPKIDSAVLRRGRWGEAAVFEALADERPTWEVRRAKIYMQCPELRLGATPDGFALRPDRLNQHGVAETGVVQAKVVARAAFKARWLDNPDDNIETGEATPPPGYVLQTLTEMVLAEAFWGTLAVLITSEFDFQLRLFEVERNREREDRIFANVANFFQSYFDPNIMPPFDLIRDERLIKALYPRDTGTTLDLTTDNRALALVDEYTSSQAEAKAALERVRLTRTELTGKLGENTYGLLSDGRCLSWKMLNRKGYAVDPTSYRAFKVLKRGPKPDDDDE
jgi:predicted phage-related endonuclease